MEKISRVTVFLDRALVTRTQDAYLEKDCDFPFIKLPQNIYLNSLRAKGLGDAKYKIRSINQRYEHLEKYSNEMVQNIFQELESLENQSKIYQEKIKKLEEYLLMLSQLKLPLNAEIPVDFNYQKCTFDEIDKLYQFCGRKNNEIEQQIFEIKKEEREISKKKKVLSKNLQQMQQGKSKTELNIDVSIDMIDKGNLSLDLSYIIPNAKWRPFYEARLYLDCSELEMVYLAEVSQKTGEDWQDVQLILSTAKPSEGLLLPDLKIWWIDFYYPPKTKSMKKERSDKMDIDLCAKSAAPVMMVNDMKPCEEEVEMAKDEEVASIETFSEIESEGLNVNFIIPKRDSIGSDGSRKKVIVDKKKFPVNIEYIAIPKLAQNAFLKVKFENQSGYPYLSGDALIFHASDYVGKSILNDTVPGQEVELFMGVDENVKVERQLISQIQSKKMFGGNKKINYKYQTTLTSFRDNDVKISVYDQLPITQNQEVKVKLESLNIPYQEIDKKNIMKWDLLLKKKEKVEILLEISVEMPKEGAVYGF